MGGGLSTPHWREATIMVIGDNEAEAPAPGLLNITEVRPAGRRLPAQPRHTWLLPVKPGQQLTPLQERAFVLPSIRTPFAEGSCPPRGAPGAKTTQEAAERAR